MNSKTDYQNQLRFWQSALLAAFFLYLLTNACLYFFISTELSATSAIGLLGIKSIPLLCFFPWLLKPNYKIAVGFCCLLLFYFTFTAFSLFQEGLRGWFAFAESGELALLFLTAFKLGKLN